MSQNPAQMVRDMEARNAAMRRYATAHAAFVTREQALAGTDSTEAYGAFVFGEWCQRALRAERDDPEPRPACDCIVCRGFIR